MQKFRAASMREAMEMVRRTLGEEAVILHAHAISDGRPDGPASDGVEIWAQPPTDSPPAAVPEAPLAEFDIYLHGLREELHAMHTQLEGIAAGMSWLGAGVPPPGGEISRYLADEMAQKLPVSGGIQLTNLPHVVAFVGPTGVGKSTMIAKLAWHYRMIAHCPVGVITTDTVRIGGAEMLRVTCGHLGCPLEMVYLPEELPAALQRLADCALVLLDTPGVSPRDTAGLAQVQAVLAQADPAEIHLVVSAGTGAASIREIVQRLAVLQADQVVVSKIDEAPALGEMLPALTGAGLAVSYLNDTPTIPVAPCIASSANISQLFIE